MEKVKVIGGGLAGCEASWHLAEAGIAVELYEMRPGVSTEAHETSDLAELVCSNSLGSESLHAASWLLKEELRRLGSLILEGAEAARVPAGASLAVDRKVLGAFVTQKITDHPNIEVVRRECTELLEDCPTIVASGPLTSPALSKALQEKVGQSSLYFYDAISPIVSADSIDFSEVFLANRYDKGETADFLNIPLEKDQYFELVHDLTTGEVVLPHAFESAQYFEGCMPVEVIAARGPRTLAFGPLKPVGLTDPKTGRRPYAVIQLRAENKDRTAYNLVGFQTKLKYPEQLRVFRKLPGLKNAEFLRLGSLHRNTYVDSPRVLLPTLQLKAATGVFLAGQITGTEGYVESTAMGLVAGRNLSRVLLGQAVEPFPRVTMIGSLLAAITDEAKKNFQPMNANIGILPPLEDRPRDKKIRNQKMCERALSALTEFIDPSERYGSPGTKVDYTSGALVP